MNLASAGLEPPFFKSPLIVSGVGRSGTSILLESLMRHREVAGLRIAGENPFMGSIIAFLKDYQTQGDTVYKAANNRLSQDDLLAAFRALIVRNSVGDAEWHQAKMWATKAFPTPHVCDYFELLFPSIRYVFIVRNPFDVTRSMLNYEGFQRIGIDFKRAVDRWINECSTYEFWEARENATLIRYEDLCADYAGVLSGVMNFCELDQADFGEVIDYASHNRINNSFGPGEDEKSFTDIDDEAVAYLIDKAGGLMEKYGYRP